MDKDKNLKEVIMFSRFEKNYNSLYFVQNEKTIIQNTIMKMLVDNNKKENLFCGGASNIVFVKKSYKFDERYDNLYLSDIRFEAEMFSLCDDFLYDVENRFQYINEYSLVNIYEFKEWELYKVRESIFDAEIANNYLKNICSIIDSKNQKINKKLYYQLSLKDYYSLYKEFKR